MATKYWRNLTPFTWSSTACWSNDSPSGTAGAAIPVIGDDVVISNVGQAAGTINITATATAKLNSWTVIGGTWTVAGSQQVNIAGTFDCQNVTWTNTGVLSLQGTGGSYDINASGTTFGCAVTLNAFSVASSSFNLLSAFTTGATQTTTLTAGTLILNNFTLTTGIFNAAATNTRQIQFGTGNIALIHTTAATAVVSLANYSNFSCSGTGGFTSAMSVTRTFTFGSTGATNTNSPNLALTSGASVPTLAAGSWFNHLNFTGSTFTLAAVTVNVNSLTLASGGTYTALTVNAVGTGTITTAGKTLTAFTVNHTGTTTLGAALSVGVTGTTTLTQGTLDLAGFTLTTGIFSSSNANTRAITFGTGNIALSHTTAATTVLSMVTATGFTWTGTGGFTVAAMSVTRTFNFGGTGGTTSNAPNLTFTTGASVATITGGGWFNKLDYGTTSFAMNTTTLNVNSITLSSSGTYTSLILNIVGSGTLTYNGKTTAGVTLLAGSPTFADTITCNGVNVNGPDFNFTSGILTPGTFTVTSGSFTYNGGTLSAVATFTHTAGTVTFNYNYSLTTTGTYTFTAGTLTLANGVTLNTGLFSSNNTNTRAIAFGSSSAGNINLTHTTAAVNALFMATLTGFSYTGPGGFTVADMANTRIFTCGTTGGTTSNAPRLTFTTGASVATLTTASWFNTLDFGTTSFNPGTTTLNLNSFTLSSSGTYTALTAAMQGTGTITSNGKSTGPLVINNGAGTTTLAAAALCTTFTMTAGTINFVTFTLTCSAGASYTAGTLSNIGTITCTTWTVTGTFTLTQGTITPSTSFVLTSGAFNYNGGTLSAVPTFTHTAGTVTLGQSYALTTTGTYTQTAGTLALAGFTLTTGIFSSNNANTRAITFGTGNIDLTSTVAATTVLSMATATGFTYTGTGGFTVAAMSNTRTFTFGSTAGGTTSNAPRLTFTTGASVATLTTASWFNTLNFGTTSFNPGTTTLNLNALTLSSSGTYTSLTASQRDTGTITSNGKSLAALTVNHTGTATLADALSVVTTGTTTLTQGTLDLAGFTLTTGAFSSSNANTRAIAFGTSNIVLTHTTAATVVLSMDTTTGFTYTGTGGFTVAAMSNTRTFTFGSTAGGTTTNAPNLTFTTGASVATLTTAGWFNTLNFGTTSFNPGTTTLNLNALTLSSSGTYTALTATMVGTGTITTNAKTIAALTINSAGTATLADALSVGVTGTTTLTQGTVNINGFTLTTGIFSSSNTNTRAIAFGTGNIVLSHTTAATVVLSMATITGFTYTGTGGFTVADMAVTRTFTFGTTGGTTSNAPNLAFTTGASVATLTTASWFNTLDFGTTSFNPGTTTLNLNALTLSSSGTYTALTATMVGTGTITTNAKTIAALTINSAGTTTLAAALTMSGALTLTQGTLACSIYNLLSDTFVSTGTATRSMTGSGTYTITGSGTTAFSNALAAGITITGLFINMNSVSAKTFAGGGGSYGILLCYPNIGALSITGSNSFAGIQVPSGLIYIEYLVVAGGGAGGTGYGGGGGGGGYLTATGLGVTPSSVITVTVGAGGTGSASPTAGDNSQLSNGIFANVTAIGGGAGAAATVGLRSGGSGGGATLYDGSTPGTGTVGQGNNGGTSGRYSSVSYGSGGGGGGAGAGGYAGSGDGIGTVASTGNGTTGGNKGNGGAGLYSSITGSSVAYAGGGGGGTWIGYVPGSPYYSHAGDGGVGGGGNGAYVDSGMTAGTVNTGGGGGGASAAGASGGSGVVIIRYADTYAAATSTTGSPTITVAGGYRVYKWTSSGTITF